MKEIVDTILNNNICVFYIGMFTGWLLTFSFVWIWGSIEIKDTTNTK